MIPDNPRTAHGDERDMRGNTERKSCEIEAGETVAADCKKCERREGSRRSAGEKGERCERSVQGRKSWVCGCIGS